MAGCDPELVGQVSVEALEYAHAFVGYGVGQFDNGYKKIGDAYEGKVVAS